MPRECAQITKARQLIAIATRRGSKGFPRGWFTTHSQQQPGSDGVEGLRGVVEVPGVRPGAGSGAHRAAERGQDLVRPGPRVRRRRRRRRAEAHRRVRDERRSAEEAAVAMRGHGRVGAVPGALGAALRGRARHRVGDRFGGRGRGDGGAGRAEGDAGVGGTRGDPALGAGQQERPAGGAGDTAAGGRARVEGHRRAGGSVLQHQL